MRVDLRALQNHLNKIHDEQIKATHLLAKDAKGARKGTIPMSKSSEKAIAGASGVKSLDVGGCYTQTSVLLRQNGARLAQCDYDSAATVQLLKALRRC